MSTRAVITFIDEDNTFHVYKHWDGYPADILKGIENAKPFAWELPRFEADEFAAAFIAANKGKGGGDIRLTHTYEDHPDLEFRYEVRATDCGLEVRIFTPVYDANYEVSGWVKHVPEPAEV